MRRKMSNQRGRHLEGIAVHLGVYQLTFIVYCTMTCARSSRHTIVTALRRLRSARMSCLRGQHTSQVKCLAIA